EVLHAGIPTPLAVTVLTDSPVRVTAEVTHGNTSLVPGGSGTQSSVFMLAVKGYQRNELIFSNTTALRFNLRNVSTFIQTDRFRYQPEETVRVRIVCVQSDNHPYKGKVDITIQDPRDNVVQRWAFSSSHLGIVSTQFSLSRTASLGQWTVMTTVNVNCAPHFANHRLCSLSPQGTTDKKAFTVEHYGKFFNNHMNLTSFQRQLRISRYDGKPLSSLDLMNSAVVNVTQRSSEMDSEPTTLTLPVPEDGNIHIKFTLQDAVDTVFIRVSVSLLFTGMLVLRGKRCLPYSKNLFRLSNQSNLLFSILVLLCIQVSSGGQVVAAGKKNSSSISLTPTMSWSPEACITVYCVLPDGEVTSDTTHMPVHQHNDVICCPLSITLPDEAYEFVLADHGDISVVNARKLTVGSHSAASALFPIRTLALGEMEISVDAISADSSDKLVRSVLVKPEGVEESFSETLFLDLAPTTFNSSRAVSFSFPPDVVPGSQRAHVAVVGDILALSIHNLDSLVHIPHTCGEQNMIHFAPSVYILQYLSQYPQDYEEIRTKALGHMMEAYQRQLSYQRDDGSFSAFGASDTSGSTWLTAFVLKCFLQAQPFMQVDQSVLSRAMSWLVSHQGAQGEFSEVGRVIHTEVQGGMDDGPVALTAFVLMTLLEDQTYGVRDTTLEYLESRVTTGVVSNYTLCLVAYALALANSRVTETALTQLSRRADMIGNTMMWTSSHSLESGDWQPNSAQIEMAAYVLLAFYKRGTVVDGIALMKWLSRQRNHIGGYGTTQDTVVALQALSYYAAFSGADAINLRLKMSIPTSNSVTHFSVNSSTYLLCQKQEAQKNPEIDIYVEGRGFALFQMNVFYNLESSVFSQRLQHATDHEAFSLDVEVFDDERDHAHMLLSICTRLQENEVISQTGMVMVDVSMLSGFALATETTTTSLIRKVETSPGKVSLYLDSVSILAVCIRLPLIRVYRVAHVQDAVVEVYDYYEPSKSLLDCGKIQELKKLQMARPP
uniref:CD109 molecule n=1 Tax=Myripristis murdjan TaxID=586833 RepID=A0A668A359_9TELE